MTGSMPLSARLLQRKPRPIRMFGGDVIGTPGLGVRHPEDTEPE